MSNNVMLLLAVEMPVCMSMLLPSTENNNIALLVIVFPTVITGTMSFQMKDPCSLIKINTIWGGGANSQK